MGSCFLCSCMATGRPNVWRWDSHRSESRGSQEYESLAGRLADVPRRDVPRRRPRGCRGRQLADHSHSEYEYVAGAREGEFLETWRDEPDRRRYSPSAYGCEGKSAGPAADEEANEEAMAPTAMMRSWPRLHHFCHVWLCKLDLCDWVRGGKGVGVRMGSRLHYSVGWETICLSIGWLVFMPLQASLYTPSLRTRPSVTRR